MSDKNVELFCGKIKSMLNASECMPFSGRYESIAALFDAIELGEKDCVYLSPFASCEVVKAVLAYNVVPVFCDVAPDSLTLDSRAFEAMVRRTVNSGELYARVVIAENFCGMPFSAKAIKDVCNRFGIILVEDCGECFGGTSDGSLCGSVGDYSIISLGRSSVFGTGGSGSLLIAMGDNALCDKLENPECGSGYQSVDDIYGESLLESAESIPSVIGKSRAMAAEIDKILTDSDWWLQRGGGRQKSSYGKIAVITQDEASRCSALSAFKAEGFAKYVKPVHAHHRACFDRGCRGFKDIVNAAAIAPRAFSVDLFEAIHNSDTERLIEQFNVIVKSTN